MAALFAVGLPWTYDGVTNHFATTTGGAASVAAVTSADTVTVDSLSGNATMTIGAAFSCSTLTINNASATVACDATHGITASGAVTLTTGTLNTNGQTCNWGSFSSNNANTRAVTLGASNITLTGSGNAWNTDTTTGYTITPGTSTINLSGGSANFFGGSGKTYATVQLTVGAATAQTLFLSACANLTLTGGAVKTGTMNLSVNTVITGTFTANGNSSTNRILINSSSLGSSRTINAAVVSVSNADFQDITGAGAGSWNLAAVTGLSGDAGGNSGITFTTPATQTHTASAGGNWSDVTKWTSRVPLPQDNVVVDVNTTGTLTADMPRLGADIDFNGFTGTGTFNIAIASFGSWRLGSGMTVSGGGLLTMSGRGSHTITSNGKPFPNALIISTRTGTYALQDALTIPGTLQLSGTAGGTAVLNTNNFNVSIGFQFNGNSGWTVNLGTSTVTLTTAATGTIWNVTGSAVMNASSSTIIFSSASALARVFSGNSSTYGTLTYTVAGSTGTLGITGANTFNTINFSDATNARTLTFPASVTNTVTNWNVNGTAGKLMTVNSSIGGTPASLAFLKRAASDYLSVQDNTATTTTPAYAGANGVLVSGTTNWLATAAPGGGSTLLMMGV